MGLIAGGIGVVMLSYYMVSPLYSPLINLLGPYLGYGLPLLLGIIGLLAGNPIHYYAIMISWIIIGIIVGISTRKGLRAMGTSILLYSLTFSFMILVLISVLDITSYTSAIPDITGRVERILSILPNMIPYNVNLIDIKNEPLISTIYSIIIAAIGKNNAVALNPETSIYGSSGIFNYSLVYPIIINIIENLAIVILVSGVIASLFKKRHKGMARAEAIIVVIITLIVISSFFVIPAGINHANTEANSANNLNNVGIQASINIITENGSLINTVILAQNSTNINSNIILAASILSNNLTYISNSIVHLPISGNLKKLLSMVPSGLFVVVSKNNYTLGSDGTSGILKNSGIINPQLLLAYNYSKYKLYVYGQDINESKYIKNVINNYNSNLSMYNIIKKYDSENFRSSALIYGYGNYSLLLGGNKTSDNERFLAGLFENPSVFHSSGKYHKINMSDIIGYNSTINFNGTVSAIGVIYPDSSNSKTSINSIFYSNNKNFVSILNESTNTTYYNTQNFNPDQSNISFNYTFPAYLYFNVKISENNHVATVINEVQNRDNSTLYYLNISEDYFIENYEKTGSLSLISGNSDIHNITLKPGEYYNFTYKIKLNGPGEFVIPYANISYNMDNKSFNLHSQEYLIKSPNEKLITVYNSALGSFFKILGINILAESIFANITIFDLIILLILILAIFIEIKKRNR